MKIWAIILVVFSLSKLFIVGSQEKHELARDLFYQLENNFEDFQKKAIIILIIDGLIGLICGMFILL